MGKLWRDDRSDWVLLALAAADGHRLSPLKLQKALFLLSEQRRSEVGADFYHFRPYYYGPFDPAVYHDADELIHDGFVQLDTNYGRRLRLYALTPEGKAKAAAVAKRHPQKAIEYLTRVVEWAQPLAFHELVRSIYEKYPKMRANSIFDDPDE